MRPGVVDDRGGRVAAGKNGGLSAKILRELHRAQDPVPLRRGQAREPRRFDVHGRPFDAELRREARRAAHHVIGAGARPDAAQERRLGLPYGLDRLVRAIRLHVGLDAIRGAAQRELAQRHQIALAEEVARGALDLLRHVHLAGLEPREQVVGRDVDQDHLVGFVEERVGNGLPDLDAGDAADDVVEAFEVLDVERREHVDAVGEKLVDVLPALRMARARDVGVRELVDEDQRGMPANRAVQIELGELSPLILDPGGRQHLEALQQRLGFLAAMRLDDADDDILALGAQRLRRGQHCIRLPDTGRCAKVDAQTAATGVGLLSLHHFEQRVGIGARIGHRWSMGRRRCEPPAGVPRAVLMASRRCRGRRKTFTAYPVQPRKGERPRVRQQSLGGEPLVRRTLLRQSIEVEVERKHVDARLAQHAECAAARVCGHERADLLDGQSASLRDARCLIVGRGDADVGIETASRCRDEIHRHRQLVVRVRVAAAP